MPRESDQSRELGVCSVDADGALRPVHRFQGGNYGLEDIVEQFRLGSLESGPAGTTIVVLTSRELHQLEIMAHAHSFDYEEPFVEMCLEMARFARAAANDAYRFVANF